MEEFKRLDRKLVYPGAIIDVYQDTVRTPDGNVVKWDFIGHKGAAAVVAVRDDGRLLMVRQYRNALDRETLEIPAGGLNGADEPTAEAARRELEEETGYRCRELEPLLTLRTTVAFCNEKIDIYVARGLTPGTQHLDEDERICVEAYTIEELTEKILSRQIEDSKTIAALLAYRVRYADAVL